jgi:hypothetical protein
VTSLLLAVAVHGQLSYSLKWEPKKGETHVYEIFIKDKETSVEAAVEHKVTEVKSDGTYTVQSRSLGALIRFGAEEIRDDRPSETTAEFDAFGQLQEISGGTAGPAKYRNALLMRFVAPHVPVKVNDAWTYARNTAKPTGLSAIGVTYSLKAVKDSIAEVTFVFTEKGGEFPQTATGTWWVDVRNGLPQRLEAKVKNFVGSESPETTVTLALRRPIR